MLYKCHKHYAEICENQTALEITAVVTVDQCKYHIDQIIHTTQTIITRYSTKPKL